MLVLAVLVLDLITVLVVLALVALVRVLVLVLVRVRVRVLVPRSRQDTVVSRVIKQSSVAMVRTARRLDASGPWSRTSVFVRPSSRPSSRQVAVMAQLVGLRHLHTIDLAWNLLGSAFIERSADVRAPPPPITHRHAFARSILVRLT